MNMLEKVWKGLKRYQPWPSTFILASTRANIDFGSTNNSLESGTQEVLQILAIEDLNVSK